MTEQAGQEPRRLQPRPASKSAAKGNVAEAPDEVWVQAIPAGSGRGRWPSAGKLFLAGFLVLLFGVILASVALLTTLVYYSDFILPGVEVLGTRVGSMTSAEAEALLQAQWQQQLVSLEHGENSWPVAAD